MKQHLKKIGKVLKKPLKIFGLLALALLIWIITPLDRATLLFDSPHPASITRYSDSHKTAFVFFTGAQSSGTALSAPLRSLWGEHADVVVVEYNRHYFNGEQTAYDTYQKVLQWGYSQVILDGASLGGLLATDVIDFDRAAHTNLKFAIMMQDVPMNGDDLQFSGVHALMQVWWPGRATDLVATDLFWKFIFHPPPHDQLGTGVDDQQLAAQYEASSTYPLSGWAGEIRYIVGHGDFLANQYLGIPLIVMQSDNDSVVSPTADRWKDVFGGGTVIMVHSTHIGFVEYPDNWRAAFEKAFAALPSGW